MSPELKEKVERLCECLTNATHERWEHTRDKTSFDYSVGQKYIRIISCEHGDHRSVWGFINKKEWRKGQTGITFREVIFSNLLDGKHQHLIDQEETYLMGIELTLTQ